MRSTFATINLAAEIDWPARFSFTPAKVMCRMSHRMRLLPTSANSKQIPGAASDDVIMKAFPVRLQEATLTQEATRSDSATFRRAFLLYRDVEARDCSVELRASGNVLGSAPECLVRSDDPEVSPIHAHITWTDESFIVRADELARGTFLNDEPLDGRRVLKHGDVIRCASLQVRYVETADPRDPLSGRTLAGRYHVGERLGEGGLCVIYKATQLALGSTVALKILGADAAIEAQWVNRFRAAAQAVSRLTHPGTVRVYDVQTSEEGLHFITLEYLEGRSLRATLNHAGKLPPAQALRIVHDACWPLVEAHGRGIVHCDLSLENIILCPAAGLGDFVRLLYPTGMDFPENPMAPRPGIVFGTPAYMAPEHVRGQSLDARTDVYALGIVLYELLTGRPPFVSEQPMEVALQQLRGTPAPLVDVPEAAARITLQALAKNPDERPASCSELAQALAEALKSC